MSACTSRACGAFSAATREHRGGDVAADDAIAARQQRQERLAGPARDVEQRVARQAVLARELLEHGEPAVVTVVGGQDVVRGGEALVGLASCGAGHDRWTRLTDKCGFINLSERIPGERCRSGTGRICASIALRETQRTLGRDGGGRRRRAGDDPARLAAHGDVRHGRPARGVAAHDRPPRGAAGVAARRTPATSCSATTMPDGTPTPPQERVDVAPGAQAAVGARARRRAPPLLAGHVVRGDRARARVPARARSRSACTARARSSATRCVSAARGARRPSAPTSRRRARRPSCPRVRAGARRRGSRSR